MYIILLVIETVSSLIFLPNIMMDEKSLDKLSKLRFGWERNVGDIKVLKHEVMNARLIKAVQELSAKLEAAEARITTLEG